MKRVTLRQAVEILQQQGIEVIWDENLGLDDFFSYYDQHYAQKLNDCESATPIGAIGNFFHQDILKIFSE